MKLPSLVQLRGLIALADTLHFGQAAADCDITQPALSAQIARLEADLGARLVERTTRNVMLTPVGNDVVARARRVLIEVEGLVSAVDHERAPLSGPFWLGVIPTIAPYVLPALLPEVRRMHPGLQLYLQEDQTARLVEGLQHGRFDAAFLALPVSGAGLSSAAIAEEPFRLLVPAGHRLAGLTERDRTVRQHDLDGEEVLLLEDGHCLRDQALAVCSRAGARETRAIRATSVSTLVQMVAGGLGVTLLPASAVPVELRGMDDVVDFALDDPVPTRTLGLVWRSSSARIPDLELLRTLITGQVEGLLTPSPATVAGSNFTVRWPRRQGAVERPTTEDQ